VELILILIFFPDKAPWELGHRKCADCTILYTYPLVWYWFPWNKCICYSRTHPDSQLFGSTWPYG